METGGTAHAEIIQAGQENIVFLRRLRKIKLYNKNMLL